MTHVMINNGSLRSLSRSVFSPTLNLTLSWQERVWQPSGTFSVFVSTTVSPICHVPVQRWDSLSSDDRVWVSLVSTTGCPRSIRRNSFFVKIIYIDLLGTGRFDFHLARFSCQLQQRVAPIYHDLGLELVGLIGNFWIVAQLVLLVVEHLLNPILFSSHVSKTSLAGGRGDMYTVSYVTSPVSIRTTFGIQ